MFRRVWWWVGGGAFVVLGLWVAWSVGPVPPATVETQVRLRVWLRGGRPSVGWMLGIGALATLWLAVLHWRTRRGRRVASPKVGALRPAVPPEPEDGPSAFAVDPWDDTVPVMPEPLRRASRAERVATLRAAAEYLAQQGRLRAAREAYVQAYELAMHPPPLRDLADDLTARIHSLERRLAQQIRRAKIAS